MLKRIVLCLTVCALAVASVATAQDQTQPQSGGGGRHGRGGGGGGRGGGHESSGGGSHSMPTPDKPTNQIEIIGVIKSIDGPNDRVTIDYEQVDALGWPHGSKPFGVAKPQLLQGVKVGDKVRFKLESSRISEIKPF